MSEHNEFYDDDVIERYLRRRNRTDNPNDSIERPIFHELVGDLRSLDIIDLGCGDARFGREALEHGARSYIGIEASEHMTNLARRNLKGLNGHVEHIPIERWQANPNEAHLITSRLALNHVENLTTVFQQVQAALRPQGRMILTVEHPVITSNFESLVGGRRTNWLVDNYFRTGARPHEWLGRDVVKYHRTFDDYFDLINASGLLLERMRESRPFRENFINEEEYRRRLRIPLFLFIAARKPEPPK